MLNKVAKEIPQTASNEDVKTEIGDEEEGIKESQEDDDVKQELDDSQCQGQSYLLRSRSLKTFWFFDLFQ